MVSTNWAAEMNNGVAGAMVGLVFPFIRTRRDVRGGSVSSRNNPLVTMKKLRNSKLSKIGWGGVLRAEETLPSRDEVNAGPDPPVSDDNLIHEIKPAPQKPRAPQADKGKDLQLLVRFLVKLGLAIGMFVLMFTFVVGIHIQHGNRMYPAILDGDVLITYKLDTYRVGDVVAYRRPDDGQVDLARIVAMGENVIQITDYGELLVNDVRPSERVFYSTKPIEDSEIEYPFGLSSDGIFLLDDYRTIGSDSRLFGQIQTSDLQGKVVYVFRRRGI